MDRLSKLVTAKSEQEAISKAEFKFSEFGYNMKVWPFHSITCISDGEDQPAYKKPVNKMFVVYFGEKAVA